MHARQYRRLNWPVVCIRSALEAEGLSLTEIAGAMGIGRTTLVRARRAGRQSVP